VDETREHRMDGLEEALRQAGRRGLPPVERWNPPYCGDIGLRILGNGTWLYQGSAIARPALVKLFASVLRRDADGRTYLVTPAEKVDVRVDDAPFLAVEMEVKDKGREQTLIFRTNVDDVFACGREHPLHFRAGRVGGRKPYALVRGRLEALVTRSLTYDLMELAVRERRGGSDVEGLWSGGEFFPLSGGEI
jgi:hypothetical protein